MGRSAANRDPACTNGTLCNQSHPAPADLARKVRFRGAHNTSKSCRDGYESKQKSPIAVRYHRGVSHAVDPANLADTAAPYGATPYLLYSSADGSARVNHVVVAVESDPAVVRVTGFGRGVASRIADDAPLSLLWPAIAEGEFSLIADGAGSIDGDVLTIAISAAVLHRPAPVDGSASC